MMKASWLDSLGKLRDEFWCEYQFHIDAAKSFGINGNYLDGEYEKFKDHSSRANHALNVATTLQEILDKVRGEMSDDDQ